MSDDADRALAQIKAALDAGPTPGPWDAFHKHKYDEWHVSVPLPRGTMRLALFTDGCPTERPQADAEYIAACNPSNMRAIVSHIDAQAAEIERLRADAERLDWLAEQLQDVQIGDTDPTAHYFDNETDVPWPVLWRRAIDYARSKE